MYSIIGNGRVIDINKENATCRVRLLGSDGLPTGKVYADVKMLHGVPPELPELHAWASTWSDHELDTAAKQNLYYNSHQPVEIV